MTTIDPGATLPHAREAEEAVLGAVLINPLVLDELDLQADDFYLQRLGWIWTACIQLKHAQTPIDLLTVAAQLDQRGLLDECGGAAFLTSLLTQVPSTLHVAAYAQIVKSMATRRRLLRAANELAALAFDEALALPEALAQAERSVRRVVEQAGGTADLEDLTQIAGRIWDAAAQRAESARQGQPIHSNRITTGLPEVDRALKKGFRRGGFYIVAGRPGQGKSAFLQTCARGAVAAGKRVATFGLEMSNEETAGRWFAAEAGIDANTLLEGVPGEADWTPFTQAIARLKPGQVFLHDRASLTPTQLRAKVGQLKYRHGLDLLVVDYLQLMQAGIRTPNREQEVSHVSRELKRLAVDLELPVLVAAQLSRAVEGRADKEPQLSDLRESGSLENDADVVAFIFQPNGTGHARLKIAKQRGGPVGAVELVFNRAFTRFENHSKD